MDESYTWCGSQTLSEWGQQKVGKYYVDGYIPSKKLVLQFHGCHFHGHGCSIDKKNDRERIIKTDEITKAIRAMGYTVIEKWECEFNKDRRDNKQLDSFIKENCELPWKIQVLTRQQKCWNLLKMIGFLVWLSALLWFLKI